MVEQTAHTGQEAWWETPAFRGLPVDLRRFFAYEARSRVIRSYSQRYIPGPLQTPEYTNALSDSLSAEMPPAAVQVITAARHLRQEFLLRRLGRTLDYQMVLEESVLLRPIGGDTVFRRQLAHLVDLARGGLIRMRVLPLLVDVPVATSASFDLLTISGDIGAEVLYRENGVADELMEHRTSTDRYLERFDRLWQAAIHEADTIGLVDRCAHRSESRPEPEMSLSEQHEPR